VVSERVRAHFRYIAEAEAELNAESRRIDAEQSPGDNILRGLDLSEFATAFGADLSRPDSPVVRKISPTSRRSSKRAGLQSTGATGAFSTTGPRSGISPIALERARLHAHDLCH
jgi:hypothetical protein